MNRLLNYLLLFIVILIFAGLVVPFAILQVQVNSVSNDPTSSIVKDIVGGNLSFPPLRNALIAGILIPVVATICLALQQFFYIKNLKSKMEYPVKKELLKQYQWVGIATGGLIALSLVFFVCAFAVGNKWDIKKWFYIGGLIVNGLYGASIYIWATIVNMRIMYDQAKQQAIIDAQNNDKNPPQDSHEPEIEETIVFSDDENESSTIIQNPVNEEQGQQATSGNF